MGSQNIVFRLSNAVSDVFLRAFVIFVGTICDHHKKVDFWHFFQYDQFSNTVLGYKKGSKINFDIGFRSATNKMWGVSYVIFSRKWSEALLSEKTRRGGKNPDPPLHIDSRRFHGIFRGPLNLSCQISHKHTFDERDIREPILFF